MSKILIVDDEAGVRFSLAEVVRERGDEAVAVASGQEALAHVGDVDAVVTDFMMPGMDGMALLQAIREKDASLPVILLTAHGSERVAVAAIKAGAYDYMVKPFDIDELALLLDRALEARRLRVENRQLVAERAMGRRIVGENAAMRSLFGAIARVADRDVTVLVRGETGTGKELVAALLHAQSRRHKRPFVKFNCAAISAELADAELFGHVKGAFTGAVGARRGFFAEADGGTLALDEIGELGLGVQAKLLRAVQEGEIQPVGSSRVEKVDVRIVAMTNRDLAAEARAGRFREDLYYRLAVVELVVPPLRERAEDIPALAEEFVRRYAQKFGLDDLALSPALLERLSACDWPGNVRQLENTIARLAALSTGGTLGVEALGSAPLPAPSSPPAFNAAETASLEGGPSLKEQVEAFERNLIARSLAATGHNHSAAARRLGASRVTLIDKIRRYGLGAGGGDT